MKISLKAARVNAGLTQSDVARMLKVSKGTIVNYEKGRSSPSMSVGKTLASLYGVRIDELIFLPTDCALSPINEVSSVTE